MDSPLLGSVLVGPPRFRHRGRGPASCSEEQTPTSGEVCGSGTTTCYRSTSALVVWLPPRRFGVASVWDVLQSRRTGFTPFRVRVGRSPSRARRRPCALAPGRIDSLPGVRAPFEESHAPAAAPHHWVACPPDVASPLVLRALLRWSDRAGDRRCRRVSPTLSFHGLLVPLRDQRSIRPLDASIAELRSASLRWMQQVTAARRGTPASSRSWGRASSPWSDTPSRASRRPGLRPFAGSRRPSLGEPKLPLRGRRLSGVLCAGRPKTGPARPPWGF
jgi:hypothetical protein